MTHIIDNEIRKNWWQRDADINRVIIQGRGQEAGDVWIPVLIPYA